MKEVWVLAYSPGDAGKALYDNKAAIGFEPDFLEFRFIGSPRAIKEYDRLFLVVSGWAKRADAKEIKKALKDHRWEQISLKELFL